MLGLNKVTTVSLIQIGITYYLTCNKQLDIVATGEKLSQQQKKLYKQRFASAYSMLKQDLGKLPILRLHLSAKIKNKETNSQEQRIIYNVLKLTKAITPTTKKDGTSLRHILPSMYLEAEKSHDKIILEGLGKTFETPLPGELVISKSKSYIVIGKITRQALLCFDSSENKYNEIKHYRVNDTKQTVRKIKSENRLYALWSEIPKLLPVCEAPFIDEYFTSKQLHQIKKAAYFSMGRLLKELEANANTESLIMSLAKRFSEQKITDLRHAIALVGIEQLPELLENQQLLQRLRATGKLNWSLIESRLNTFIQFVEHYKSIDPHFTCQKVINYALKYLAFTFKVNPHGVILPTQVLVPNFSVSSLTAFTNFFSVSKVKLPAQLSDNPFYEVSQSEFNIKQASQLHQGAYLHTVLCNLMIKGNTISELSALEQQRLNFAAERLKIDNLDNYLNKLLDFSPVNTLY